MEMQRTDEKASKKISALICVLTLHKRTQLNNQFTQKIESAESNEGATWNSKALAIETTRAKKNVLNWVY